MELRAVIEGLKALKKPSRVDLWSDSKYVVEAIERRMIGHALEKYHWNKQKAAQELGLSRQGLIKKLKRLAITR